GVGEGEGADRQAGGTAVGGGGEAEIVVRAAVLGVGQHGVVGRPAAAVVVRLEVARRLRETVLVVDVVGDVDGVEQVHLGDGLVLRDGRLLRGIEGEPAEVQGGAAVGAPRTGVRNIVVVAVEVCVDVVAAPVRDLPASAAL